MSENFVHNYNSPQNCHTQNHLCQIIIRKDLARIKQLVKDAQFYCKNCGRAAQQKDNLCNPSKI